MQADEDHRWAAFVGAQPRREHGEDGVIAAGTQRRHVQHRAHRGPASLHDAPLLGRACRGRGRYLAPRGRRRTSAATCLPLIRPSSGTSARSDRGEDVPHAPASARSNRWRWPAIRATRHRRSEVPIGALELRREPLECAGRCARAPRPRGLLEPACARPPASRSNWRRRVTRLGRNSALRGIRTSHPTAAPASGTPRSARAPRHRGDPSWPGPPPLWRTRAPRRGFDDRDSGAPPRRARANERRLVAARGSQTMSAGRSGPRARATSGGRLIPYSRRGGGRRAARGAARLPRRPRPGAASPRPMSRRQSKAATGPCCWVLMCSLPRSSRSPETAAMGPALCDAGGSVCGAPAHL